jgi:hypothetical protein
MSWHHLEVDDEAVAFRIANDAKVAAQVAMIGPSSDAVAISSCRAVGTTAIHFYFSPAVASIGRAFAAAPCGKPTLEQAGGRLSASTAFFGTCWRRPAGRVRPTAAAWSQTGYLKLEREQPLGMRRLLTHLLFWLLLVSCTAGLAADIRLAPLNPATSDGPDAVLIYGRIEKGDYARLQELARQDKLFPARTFVLASPGGDLEEAMRIGQALRGLFATVFVSLRHGRCASACFLIYVAAVERSAMTPALGIHRPYFESRLYRDLPLAQAESQYAKLLQRVRSYLQNHDVPQYLIERMFNMASTEVSWLSAEDVAALGRRAPWWEQVLIDRCRLDKRLEARYLEIDGASQEARRIEQSLSDVASCAYYVSEAERKAFHRQLAATPR